MTPLKAAEAIGCSPQQVRTLIRKGRIVARRVKNDAVGGTKFYYDIDAAEIERFKDSPGFQRRPRQ